MPFLGQKRRGGLKEFARVIARFHTILSLSRGEQKRQNPPCVWSGVFPMTLKEFSSDYVPTIHCWRWLRSSTFGGESKKETVGSRTAAADRYLR